jgi:glycosyltransferase involved in cell wall biosynthesis
LVAGDGEERARLEARADARVRFLGPLSREGVLELFAAADASILSSAWENFPHTLVEALAVGTPVIATEVGGVPEIVEDGVNGLLVPPHDPGALAAAMRRYFEDDELRARLNENAAASVERFAPERVLDTLESVLGRAAR